MLDTIFFLAIGGGLYVLGQQTLLGRFSRYPEPTL